MTYPIGTSVIVLGKVIGVRGEPGAEDYQIETYDGAQFWVSWVVVDATGVDWHPIKSIDDLPKEAGIFLVTWEYRCETAFYGTIGHDWAVEHYVYSWYQDGAPIAWAPLPEPYKEVSE